MTPPDTAPNGDQDRIPDTAASLNITIQATTLYVVRCSTCRDLIGSTPDWQEAGRIRAEHVEAHREQ